MDVDSDNFSNVLPGFETALGESEFVGIDLEMSGIHLPSVRLTLGEMVDTRYSKCCEIVRQFAVMQVGVALCKQAAKGKEGPLLCSPYTFHVFPRPIEDATPQHIPSITLCSSAFAFHRANKLDFERWISKGITFVNGKTEEMLAKKIAATDKEETVKAPQEKIVFTKARDIQVVAEATAGIDKMIADGEKEVKLPHMNSFQARAIYQHLDVLKKSDATLSTNLCLDVRRYGDQKWMVHRYVLNVNPSERQAIRDAERKKKEARLFDQVGFRHVWKAICSKARSLALHNGFMDLLFLYHHFEGPLPDTLAEFKAALKKIMPNTVFYDTKFIADTVAKKAYSFKFTSLSEVAGVLQKDMVKTDFPAEFTKFSPPKTSFFGRWFGTAKVVEEQYHEAGYDALQTARIFDHFKRNLFPEGIPSDIQNVININRSIFRLALGKEEDPCTTNGYFRYLYDFPASVVEATLRTFMEPFCLENGLNNAQQVEFKWCDDRSAVMVVHRLKDWSKDPQERGGASKVGGGGGGALSEEEAAFAKKLSDYLAALTSVKSAPLTKMRGSKAKADLLEETAVLKQKLAEQGRNKNVEPAAKRRKIE